jgi:hypothetical protein
MNNDNSFIALSKNDVKETGNSIADRLGLQDVTRTYKMCRELGSGLN